MVLMIYFVLYSRYIFLIYNEHKVISIHFNLHNAQEYHSSLTTSLVGTGHARVEESCVSVMFILEFSYEKSRILVSCFRACPLASC